MGAVGWCAVHQSERSRGAQGREAEDAIVQQQQCCRMVLELQLAESSLRYGVLALEDEGPY